MSPAGAGSKTSGRAEPTANDEMSARTRKQLVAAAIKLFSANGYVLLSGLATTS